MDERARPSGQGSSRAWWRGRRRASAGAGRARRGWVRAAGWISVGLCATLAAAVALAPTPPAAGGAPTLIYDRSGDIVASLSEGTTDPIVLAQVPLALQEATIATEDASFYSNHGVNPAALARAAVLDIRARAVIEGGSTITQQLAKTLYLTQTRTLRRKLEELVYTLKLEAAYSKKQILLMYLNTIYYGEGASGVGAAAQAYFATDVSSLDLAQCALLAGLPNAPQAFDPYLRPTAARSRQQWVLHRMLAVGFITAAQARAAAAEPLHFVRGRALTDAPAAGYFVGYVLAEIGAHSRHLAAAVRRGGYRVYTTLDRSMQSAADRDFTAYMPPGYSGALGSPQPEGALVAIDPHSGAVRALVGGRSDQLQPYNRAIYAMRQPGSTFKPILYAAALAAGHTVTERQFDGPVTYPGAGGRTYTVTDFEPYAQRWLTMREAMAMSTNVVAVKWAKVIGPAQVIAMARRMGLWSPLQPTLPLALGTNEVTPLEMTAAYTPLANLGTAYRPWSVATVVGPGGERVWVPRAPAPHRAMDPGVAYIVTSLLQSVMTDGTGQRLRPLVDRPVAGKTGSTNDLKDAWFIGYTPDLVVGVWVGDDRPAPLQGTGATVAGPVWAHFIADALAGTPSRDWLRPANVLPVTVSTADGLLPHPSSPTVTELFLQGTQPTQVSPLSEGGAGDPGLIGTPNTQSIPPFLGTLPIGSDTGRGPLPSPPAATGRAGAAASP